MVKYSWTVFLALLSTVSIAGPAEESTISTFEAYCIENINQPSKIPGLLKTIGIRPLNAEHADRLLDGRTGKVWYIAKESNKMALLLTDQGVCSIYSTDTNQEVMASLFASTFRNKLLSSDDIGSQKQEMFLVSQAGRNGGDEIHIVVMTNRSKLASVPGMILNAIPESLAKEMGLPESEWP